MPPLIQSQAPIPQSAFIGFNKTKVTIDFTQAAWNTVANHRVFTVSGLVRCVVFYYCTSSLTSSGSPTISFGITSSTTDYAPAQAFSNVVTGTAVLPGSAAIFSRGVTWSAYFSTQKADVILAPGQNIGYAIATAAMTGGSIDAYCFWTPISDDGSLAAATGGAL